MHAFVSGDELIGKAQARHQASFLQPKDRAETSAKENPFNSSESDNAFCERTVVNPVEGPFCFFLDAIHCVNGVEKLAFFIVVFDVGINEKRVRFRMDVFHHDLKAVEKLGFCVLYFRKEILGEIFIHDAVGCRKKGKDVFDKIALVIIELVIPINKVGCKVNFFSSPKAGFRLFIKTPNVIVLYWKQHKSIGIVLKNRFRDNGVLRQYLSNGSLLCSFSRRFAHVSV